MTYHVLSEMHSISANNIKCISYSFGSVQQYDGVLTIKPQLKVEGGVDNRGECNPYKRDSSNVAVSESFHVVNTDKKIEVTLYLRNLIIPSEDLYCDIVDSSTEVSVSNRIGLVAGNLFDDKVLSRKGANAVERYTRCSDTCILGVDELKDGDTKSKITLELQTGIPKITVVAGAEDKYKFTKTITISDQAGSGR